MPKRKKYKTKQRKPTFSERELLLAKLHKYANQDRFTEDDKKVAYSLINWHLRRNGLTGAQWKYAEGIIKRADKAKNPDRGGKKHYLYAISDGEMLKLGKSKNPKQRIKDLQTSNARNLSIKWEYYTGTNAQACSNLEKKLHRRCRKYRVRGEWFKMECFDLVKTFRGQDSKPSQISKTQAEIVVEANKHI